MLSISFWLWAISLIGFWRETQYWVKKNPMFARLPICGHFGCGSVTWGACAHGHMWRNDIRPFANKRVAMFLCRNGSGSMSIGWHTIVYGADKKTQPWKCLREQAMRFCWRHKVLETHNVFFPRSIIYVMEVINLLTCLCVNKSFFLWEEGKNPIAPKKRMISYYVSIRRPSLGACFKTLVLRFVFVPNLDKIGIIRFPR